MIEPGAVFELPATLVRLPDRERQADPPPRRSRWVLVISSAETCADMGMSTVLVVVLSSQVEYGGRYDVEIVPPVGGVRETCIAQTDIVVPIHKDELRGPRNGARYRGTVLTDTLRQVKAALRDYCDL